MLKIHTKVSEDVRDVNAGTWQSSLKSTLSPKPHPISRLACTYPSGVRGTCRKLKLLKLNAVCVFYLSLAGAPRSTPIYSASTPPLCYSGGPKVIGETPILHQNSLILHMLNTATLYREKSETYRYIRSLLLERFYKLTFCRMSFVVWEWSWYFMNFAAKSTHFQALFTSLYISTLKTLIIKLWVDRMIVNIKIYWISNLQ